MTKSEFIQNLGLRPQFVSLVIDTEATLVKPKSNPFFGLRKISYRLFILNFMYERSVIAQLIREGSDPELYISGGRRNGLEYVDGSKCLMFHPNKVGNYIWVKEEKLLEESFFLNGIQIEKEKLNGFLYLASPALTQEPLEKKIVVKNIKLENVVSLTANGQIFY